MSRNIQPGRHHFDWYHTSFCQFVTVIFLFLARDSTHYVERAICYRPSVCPSLCRMGGSAKTVEVKIMPGKFNLLHTASKFALFLMSGLKDEKLTKIETYMKTETRKLYSRVLWIFLPNVIKMDPYNVERYRFKVDVFLRHSVVSLFLLLIKCGLNLRNLLFGKLRSLFLRLIISTLGKRSCGKDH